jgi:hypothetical protein
MPSPSGAIKLVAGFVIRSGGHHRAHSFKSWSWRAGRICPLDA